MMSEVLADLALRHTEKYEFPVLFNADIGHTDPLITIPLAVNATLDSENNLFSIDESICSVLSA